MKITKEGIMTKVNKTSFPKSAKAFRNDPVFYEELTILKAQEKIAELMVSSNTSKTKLATLLNQSKAHVTEMLSDGRNLTLRTFARICFYLNAEIEFRAYVLGTKLSLRSTDNDAYQFSEAEGVSLDDALQSIVTSREMRRRGRVFYKAINTYEPQDSRHFTVNKNDSQAA